MVYSLFMDNNFSGANNNQPTAGYGQEPASPTPQPQTPSYSQPQPQAQKPSAPNFQSPPEPKKPLIEKSHVSRKAEEILMFSYFFVAAVLLFRFVLSLLGANRRSIFVDLIYQLASPFMIPFENMFGGPVGNAQFSIEFEVLFALVIYAVIFYGLARLVRIIFQ